MPTDFSKTKKEALVKHNFDTKSGAFIMKIVQCYNEEKFNDVNDPEKVTEETIKMKLVPVKRLVPTYKLLKEKPQKGTKDIVVLDGKYYKVTTKEEKFYYPDGEEKAYPVDLKIISYGKKHFQASMFNSMPHLIIKDPKFTLKDTKAIVMDFDEGGLVEKKVPTYTELIGKEIGVMLKYNETFKRAPYDGYTGEKIFLTNGARIDYKANPNIVWMGDPSARKKIEFVPRRFFNPEDYRTFTETEEKTPAIEIYKFMHNLEDYAQKELSEEDWDALRLKMLKKTLTKNNQPFDPNMFRYTAVSQNAPKSNSDIDVSDIDDDEDYDLEGF